MEILRLSGYILQEKVQIAVRYLVPRQLEAHGLSPRNLAFQTGALEAMITGYTREAGVRNLERTIGKVARKVARKLAEESGKVRKVTVRASKLQDYLGPAEYESELAQRVSLPGVAIGLAWTPAGGEILFVESSRMPGAGGLTLTGQLGDVMKESARTALSLLRSRSQDLGIPAGVFKETDLHIHVPAGAIPKDGPSAGVTMATCLASLFADRVVPADLAMTGEITLRGKILPVGGVKEKVLAAHRAGLRRIIIPARNEKDLRDIPTEIRADLEFLPAEQIDDVWRVALSTYPARQKSGSRKVARKKPHTDGPNSRRVVSRRSKGRGRQGPAAASSPSVG
ncbi:MAG: S16 family serine protease, partial [Acidobacteriota bacterium]